MKIKKSTVYMVLALILAVALIAVGCGAVNNGTLSSDPTGTKPAGTTATDPTDPGETTEPTLPPPGWENGFIAAAGTEVTYYDANGTALGTVKRGTQVVFLKDTDGTTQIQFANTTAYLKNAFNVVSNLEEAVLSQTLYVKSAVNLRDVDGKLLAPLAKKGDDVTVTGFDYLNADGSAHMYKVDLDGKSGYIMPWYVVNTEEEALVNYDYNGAYTNAHSDRGNRFGGGGAANLDYFPREKGDIAGNVMPEECRTLYLNSSALNNLDAYITLAKSSGINAFCVDIMDGDAIGYKSPVMEKYSPSTVRIAAHSAEFYAKCIQKIKDAGFYVIGRITAFNDTTFVKDNKSSHPEAVITGTDGNPLKLNSVYWPSAYSRLAWQYKVDLAVEAVELMGFNEIQYDYVRFPDLTSSYEEAGTINYHNVYGETKAQAIQRFLMYATDILHEKGVYVSADVFGETANNYVAAYGQYWPAISNVVDVISGMPYPDHWAPYGGFIPWEDPYRTIYDWGTKVVKRQAETATPAVVRTWIQAYDTNWKKPYVTYDAAKVAAQIKALRDTGCTGGFLTWNGSSSLSKYQAISSAFGPAKKED